MRLIDAEALAKFIDYGHLHNPNEKAYSENDIREMIDMMPTANLLVTVPIMCKDCKHYRKHSGHFESWRFKKGDGVCKYHNYLCVESEKDYCAWGEKKNETD